MLNPNELSQLIRSACEVGKMSALEKAAEGQGEILLLFEQTGPDASVYTKEELEAYGRAMEKVGFAKGKLGLITRINLIVDSSNG